MQVEDDNQIEGLLFPGVRVKAGDYAMRIVNNSELVESFAIAFDDVRGKELADVDNKFCVSRFMKSEHTKFLVKDIAESPICVDELICQGNNGDQKRRARLDRLTPL